MTIKASSIILGITLLGSLSLSNKAFAQLLTYHPPSDRQQQQQTQSATTRGCGKNVAQLQLLAPSNHIGATVLEQPTFLFFLSHPPQFPLELSVTRPYQEETLWKSSKTIEKAGIVAITLPKSLEIKVDTPYILTAKLPCDPSQSDSSVFVRAIFQRIDPEQIKELHGNFPSGGTTPDLLKPDNVAILATQGIWYETLYWAYLNSQPNFQHLLNAVGINLELNEKSISR